MTFHNIYFGDCREVMKLIEIESVHLVVTSPPYYNARGYSQYETYQHYLNFMEEVITELHRLLVPGGYFCLNTTSITERKKNNEFINRKLYFIPYDLLKICEKIGFELIWDVIWLKPKSTQALWRSSDYNYNHPYPFHPYLNCFHEYIWILRKGEPRIISSDVLNENKINKATILKYSYREWEFKVATPSKEMHPAPYPLSLPKYCIELYSIKGDVVLDPFLGTGTTTKAAMLLNRNSYGIEANKEYKKLIIQKIKKQKKVTDFFGEADKITLKSLKQLKKEKSSSK